MKKIAFLVLTLNLAIFSFASAQTQSIVDGDLIKTADNPDVYIVKIVGAKKFKRLILNPDIFNSYGHLKWSDIKTVDQATEDQFKVSTLVIEVNNDGSVADPKVYRISSSANSDVGEKRWFDLSASEFEQAGFDWDSIYHINHTEASKSFYPEKTELKYVDVENENKETTSTPEEPTTPTVPETPTATTTQPTTPTPEPVVYKTSITVTKRFDSPSGLSIPGSGTVIGKFIIHNDLNATSQSAIIKNVGISLSGSLAKMDGRKLYVYKDSVSSSNLLASYTYPDGSNEMSSPAISEHDFTDINVIENKDQTFLITLDTLGSVEGNSVTVSVSSITWSDGTTDLISEAEGLPLALGTLTY